MADPKPCLALRGGLVRSRPTVKDRNRDAFFRRNFTSLPRAIQDNYGNASVAEKRRLVNQLITRSADGKWSFDAQSPIVSEWQEKYVDVSKERGLVTKPAGRASHMWGGVERA